MTQTNFSEDQSFLASLALAMVEKPRANLNELANAIGVSKATLYRFCRTRNELIERLTNYSSKVLIETIEDSLSDADPSIEALKRLADNLLTHSEFTLFFIHYWQSENPVIQALDQRWTTTLDSFFLRGQQAGLFRIDITAPALTELWISIIIGFIDAEGRGRVARAGLSTLIVTAFLQGTAVGVLSN
ncbi:LacI family DNA-binding transcriptional regulator [Orbus sasakiae]|uniref:LacI family DNA-binding transcriptional regulator n=1 Tax=Orbus sasakiae TaxID=1078475 RepID=A0ABP9ND81_9GAMM